MHYVVIGLPSQKAKREGSGETSEQHCSTESDLTGKLSGISDKGM